MEQYTIQEISHVTSLSAHTLRYYEKIGLLRVGRNGAGHRVYTALDLKLLKFIAKLRETGMPIKDLVAYTTMLRAGDHTATARKQLLYQHKEQVEEQITVLQENLEMLKTKIQLYEQWEQGAYKEEVAQE